MLEPGVIQAAARWARVIDFFWGFPDDELVSLVHKSKALACWQVGSLEEAVAAEKVGCDFVIVQGIEAGGHIRGKLGVLQLLAQVVDAVKVPVLAAGGIGNARALAGVIAAGAAGARMGTRFLAAEEANAHPDYVQALIEARAEDSLRSNLFEVDCPLCPSTHGVLRAAVEAAQGLSTETAGEWHHPDGVRPIPRFGGTPPNRQIGGNIRAMAMYAGQSVSDVTRIQPAREIIREIVGGAERLLHGMSIGVS
jgi:enoyl-[acyl-carrier protein] reductase II